jgi:4-methyl-5(b-hydroxyethyl)-thiazole monophosphate biosynthesis
MRVLVPLAAGCEEIEAVTIVDVLRRGGIEVVTASLEQGPLRASRGVTLVADTTLNAVMDEQFAMLVLPGGGPGAEALRADGRIHALLERMAADGRYTAAICAAPKVLAAAGLLDGKRATAYPGVLEQIVVPGMNLVTAPVVRDGNVITSQGPGTAMDFALELLEILAGPAKRREVEQGLRPTSF